MFTIGDRVIINTDDSFYKGFTGVISRIEGIIEGEIIYNVKYDEGQTPNYSGMFKYSELGEYNKED